MEAVDERHRMTDSVDDNHLSAESQADTFVLDAKDAIYLR
jgi:hypothetical protein